MGELALQALAVGLVAGWIIHKAPDNRDEWRWPQWVAFVMLWGIMGSACLIFWAWVVVKLGLF